MSKIQLSGANITQINEVLSLDGSAYVNLPVDVSQNKVLKFNLWMDSSTIATTTGMIFNLRASQPYGLEDRLGVWQTYPGNKLSIEASPDGNNRVSQSFEITNDMLNKVLRCEVRKADKHLHYFKINDVSIISTGAVSLSGSGGYFGLDVINAAVWDIELYDYDTSLFTNGTLSHKWKGYPSGSTNTAWEDVVGTNDGTIALRGEYASTRNITGVGTNANKLQLTGGTESNKLQLSVL